jgi:hypothetical protein
MAVPNTVRRAGPFTGGAVFPFGFKVFADSDIQVVVADSDGVETVLVLDTDYSVTLNTDQEANPGGEVSYASLGVGETLTIIGALDESQPVTLANLGGFSPSVVMKMGDRLAMLVQQLSERINRSVLLPISSTLTDVFLPNPVAGKFLRGKQDGTGFENADLATGIVGLPLGVGDGGTGATTPAGARANLGLASGATTAVGTAATKDVGTAAGNVVELDGSGRLPAVDGSQLIGLASVPSLSVVDQAVTLNATVNDIKGKIIRFTASSVNLNLPAAAGAAACWCWVYNAAASGDVTIDPNGAETLDGLATRLLRPGDRMLLFCDGTKWESLSGAYSFVSANQAYALNTIFTIPHGLGERPTEFDLELVCTDAGGDLGYAQNEAINADIGLFGRSYGSTFRMDATNLYLHTQQSVTPTLRNKLTNTSGALAAGKWAIRFKAKVKKG